MSCNCNFYRGDEDEYCPRCGKSPAEILFEDEDEEMNDLNMELNQLQSIEEESNIAEDNQIAIIESEDDESEQSDEEIDEDDNTLKGVVRKILNEDKDKFSRFADAKRTLHELYEKADQLEIAMAMIFGQKFGTFTDVLGDALSDLLDFEIHHDAVIQQLANAVEDESDMESVD